jgi:hypothetical protein
MEVPFADGTRDLEDETMSGLPKKAELTSLIA